MMDKCPGARRFLQPKPEIIICPHCGGEVEIWTDEVRRTCRACGGSVRREQAPACLEWCQHARECVGEEAYGTFVRNRTTTMKRKLLHAMEKHFHGDSTKMEHSLMVANLALTGVAWFLGQIGLPMPGEISLLIPQDTIGRLVWVAVSITAGICEETAFRGYLMTRLRILGKFKTWVIPTIISAVAFGACHAYQGWPGFIIISIYGAMFSLLYIRTRSIWPCIIAHFFQHLRVPDDHKAPMHVIARGGGITTGLQNPSDQILRNLLVLIHPGAAPAQNCKFRLRPGAKIDILSFFH